MAALFRTVWLAASLSFVCSQPGAFKNLMTDSDTVQSLAEVAAKELDDRSNSLFSKKLVKVTSAKVQVVSGLKYEIGLELGTSDCLKSQGKDLDTCNVNKIEECVVTIWVQVWLNKQDVTDFDCKPQKSKPQTTEKEEDKSNVGYSKTQLDAAHNYFNQARMNVDMIMNQIPNLPAVEPEAPKSDEEKKHETILGGDDHDIGNYGAFTAFIAQHNKVYKDDDEKYERFLVFRENMKKVLELRQNEHGSGKYGATEFADMTEEEFRSTRLSPRWDQSHNSFLTPADIPEGDVPDAWDWREHNAVTEVKNQGSCGSCWAFSTTGNVEGQWAIKSGKLTSLSEQELVDCDKLDDGCDGGLPSNAYQEIIRLGGLETETDYPYEAEDEKCAFIKSKAKVDITGALNISSNEDDMKKWLQQNGPISIGINANAMQFYMGGISHPFSFLCDPDNLDHGVLIVGYGIKSTWLHGEEPYWIVKNSWGPTWGESGYYLVYRGSGVCGLNRMPTSALIKN